MANRTLPSTRTMLRVGMLAGAVAGVSAAAVARRHLVTRPESLAWPPGSPGNTDVPGPLLPDHQQDVIASDGVRLYVEEDGAPDAPFTIVFAHGYALTMECWAFQRAGLRDQGRLVFFDERSHGRSGRSDAAHCTVEQVADDMMRIIDATAPSGPVMLVGHSMGGMGIFALAQAHPEIFGPRVKAVALLSTSAGELSGVTFGLPAMAGAVLQKVLPRLKVGPGRQAALIERGRHQGSDLSRAITKHVSFASDVPPGVLSLMDRLISDTPVDVLTAFLPTFASHDQSKSAPILRGTEALILVGDHDVLTPVEHSAAVAAVLPDARYVVVPDAGHMVILEYPDLVNAELAALAARARERVDQ